MYMYPDYAVELIPCMFSGIGGNGMCDEDSGCLVAVVLVAMVCAMKTSSCGIGGNGMCDEDSGCLVAVVLVAMVCAMKTVGV